MRKNLVPTASLGSAAIFLVGLSLACGIVPQALLPNSTPTITTVFTGTALPTSTAMIMAAVMPTLTLTQANTPSPTFTDTTAPPTATATKTATVALTPPPEGFLAWDIYPDNGALTEQLFAHTQLALAMGLMPYVEFTATWCPACQAIERSLSDGNELMVDACQGTYIIRVDVDAWDWNEREKAGFEVEFIPIFYLLDREGQPTGNTIGGDAWGDNIPANMAPPLKEFFQAHGVIGR